MLITLFSCLAAALFLFFPFPLLPENLLFLSILMTTAATAILIVCALLYSLILIPAQNLEQGLTPRLIDLFRQDSWLRAGRFYLFLFSFLSYFVAILASLANFPYKPLLLAAWIIGLGVALDLIRDSLKRMTHLLSPTYLADLLAQQAKIAAERSEDPVLRRKVDALSEMAIRSLERSSTALSTQIIDSFPAILNTFFISSKSIGHVDRDKQMEKKTGLDEASYTSFYFLQRLQMINDRALHVRLESICSQIIMALGKIIAYSAKFDLSMVGFPTRILTRFALRAQQHQFDEVAALASTTLVEVAKSILTEVDLTYSELQDPFGAIIEGLRAIAEEGFKKDKTISVKLLTRPLKDLKERLENNEKLTAHRDLPDLINHLNNVLAEFDALEQVMRTIPPIPTA